MKMLLFNTDMSPQAAPPLPSSTTLPCARPNVPRGHCGMRCTALRSINTRYCGLWPMENRHPMSSQMAWEAKGNRRASSDTQNFQTRPPATTLWPQHCQSYLLHLYELFPSSCSSFTNCSKALVTLWAAWEEKSINTTLPLTATCSKKEKGKLKGIKAKVNFYLKRKFSFTIMFTFIHVHIKSLPAPQLKMSRLKWAKPCEKVACCNII